MPNLTNIRELGNQLLATYDDGSTKTLYPTTGGLWLPSSTGLPNTPGGNDSLQIVSPLPTSLSGTAVDGTVYNFNATQIQRMAQVLTAAIPVNKVTRDVLVVVFITAIVESSFRNYSNTSHYPETGSLPDIDANGSDSDSVGIFQQRPAAGWGTPTQCCTVSYETQAFLGGPSGPNGGSPMGLFDHYPSGGGWSTPGTAAQAVQVSAYPDRYDNVVPVANALLSALLVSGSGGSGTLAWPFALGDITSDYGPRINPVTGRVESLHDGVDFGEAKNTPIHAVADGVVSSIPAFSATGYGNICYLQHTQFGGHTTTTFYGHQVSAPIVHVGDHVNYGDIVGYVDSTGLSTGNHLHFGTWDGPAYAQTINPHTFMAKYGAATAESAGWD